MKFRVKTPNDGLKILDPAMRKPKIVQRGLSDAANKYSFEESNNAEKAAGNQNTYATDKAEEMTAKGAEHAIRSASNIGKTAQRLVDGRLYNRRFSYDQKTASDSEFKGNTSSSSTNMSRNPVNKSASGMKSPKSQAANKIIRFRGQGGPKTVSNSAFGVQKASSGKAARNAFKASGSAFKKVQSVKKAATTSKAAAIAVRKAAAATAKAAKVVARATAKAIKLTAKAAVTAAKAIVKLTALAIKGLIAIIAAGGWIVIVIVIVIGAILLILNSAFGIFYSNEDTGSGLTMSQVVTDINADFQSLISEKITNASAGHENVTVVYDSDSDGDSDSVNNWADILAVYAVKTTMAETDTTDVLTVTEGKKKAIKEIFWDMNSVSVKSTVKTETVTTKDENGNKTTQTIEKTIVKVDISSEDYSDAARRYAFNDEQTAMLEELMSPENYPLFAQLTGEDYSDGMMPGDINRDLPVGYKGSEIVKYALTRLGDPYSKSKRGQGRYVDCSYFVRWAYQQAGVKSYRAGTAAEQARYCVNHDCLISKAQMQPGDVIFWRKNGCMCAGDHCGRYHNIHHVGLYIGKGKVIEASSSRGRVVIRKLWGDGPGRWEIAYFARPHVIN